MTIDVTDARALWSTAFQNDLPDNSFAFIEAGGKKDASGRTTPRTLRHLPYKDASGKLDEAHVRNALARLDQTAITDAAKASARAKLVAAAKKLGIDVSEEASEKKERASMPTDTRAASTDGVERLFVAPISRVDPDKRLVTVTATSEAIDTFGTVFDYEASKEAFTRWVGNIREMHQPKAVGTRVAVHCDDATRKIDVTLRVSKGAQDTWEKILDGTLKGASIGAANVTWERPVTRGNGRAVPVARKYDLAELSLVDNPSNPDALGITVLRAAQPDTNMLDEIETTEERAAAELEAFRAAAVDDLQGEHDAAMAAAPRLSGVVDTGAVSVPLPTAPSMPLGAHASSPTGVETMETRMSHGPAAPQQIIVTPPVSVQVDPRALELRRREQQGRADAEYIRRAGDAAEATANLAPLDPDHETMMDYIARRAVVRASAEAKAIEELRALRAQQATATRAASKKKGAAAAAHTTAAHTTAAGTAAAAAATAVPADERGAMSASSVIPLVQTTASTSPAVESAALGSASRLHVHSHEHDGMAHESHAHQHTHEDGTSHSHSHLHQHDHHEHDTLLRAAGAAGAHSHEHSHAHDHLHTFRAGQPTDSRLVTADALTSRAPFGSPADGSDNRPAPPLTGMHETGTLTTTSGGKSGKAVSPILSVQPQAVGHLSMFNSEDAAALMGGVPAAAEQRPTPTSDVTLNPSDFHAGGHTTSPDRTTAGGAGDDEFDADGDHDGAAEDQPETPARPPQPTTRPATIRPTDGFSATPGSGYGQVPGPRAATAEELRAIESLVASGLLSAEQARALIPQGANVTNHGVVPVDASTHGVAPGVDDDSGEYAEAAAADNDGDADDARTPARPPRATTRPAGNGPATPEVGKPGGSDTSLAPFFSPERPAGAAPVGKDGGLVGSGPSAQVTRKGARISAESRVALHGMRDAALDSVKRACAHCNDSGECPECADLMAVLNGGVFDRTGDHAPDDDSAPSNESDTALFGSLRVVTALVLRDQQRLFRALTTELRAQMADLRQENEELRTQLADMQLTLADHQRGTAASVTRGVEERLAAASSAMTTTLSTTITADVTRAVAQQFSAQLSAALQPTTQRLEALASSVEGVGADVEKIAAQPAPLAAMNAPALYASDKRLALHDPYGAQGVSSHRGAGAGAGDLSVDDQMRVLQELANSLPHSDVAARSAIAGRMAALSAHPFGANVTGQPGRR